MSGWHILLLIVVFVLGLTYALFCFAFRSPNRTQNGNEKRRPQGFQFSYTLFLSFTPKSGRKGKYRLQQKCLHDGKNEESPL